MQQGDGYFIIYQNLQKKQPQLKQLIIYALEEYYPSYADRFRPDATGFFADMRF
jgi:hypothetical protein